MRPEWLSFIQLVEERRSVRIFEEHEIPDDVVQHCLELALLSPNSSNLQPWEFYRIRMASHRKELSYIFLGQAAARTCSEMVVAVARTSTWDEHRREVVRQLEEFGDVVPEKMMRYYAQTLRFTFNRGRFGWRGILKNLVEYFLSFSRSICLYPNTIHDQRLWAAKSVSLACQTFMLAVQAAGYNTCALEGFDKRKLKKFLKLPNDARIVMGIAVGKEAPYNVKVPRVRVDPRKLIHRR